QEGALVARLQQEEESSVHTVAFSPDGEFIVVGCGDKSVKVWTLSEQLQSCVGHEDTVQCVAVTADGRAVSCSHDKTLRVWRLPRRSLLYSQAPFVSAPVYVPGPKAMVATHSPGTLLASRAQEQTAKEAVKERGEKGISSKEVSAETFETCEDDVASSCVEEPAARVPETPPKLQLPKSPAGSARERPSAGQCWSILPTTMAGSGNPSASKPLHYLSCPAGGKAVLQTAHSPTLATPCRSMLVQGPLDSTCDPGRPPSPRPMIVEPVTRSVASHPNQYSAQAAQGHLQCR
ncbi:Transcriptional repressor rco-1, partial [Durusdinium trenchii]